jgi:hypothetical protein
MTPLLQKNARRGALVPGMSREPGIADDLT